MGCATKANFSRIRCASFSPGFWNAGESVVLRLDKHFMYLKREDGSEAKFLIIDKAPLHSARNLP